jgi:DNA ligase-1
MTFDIHQLVQNTGYVGSFKLFCEVAQCIAETRKSSEKTEAFVTYLKSLDHGHTIQLACQFIGEGAFATNSGQRASVGHTTIAQSASDYLEIDYDHVLKPSRLATGSASEAISKLMENLPSGRAKRTSNTLQLSDVMIQFDRLRDSRKKEEKVRILHENWSSMSPVEIKYFLRILGGGSLRIGFDSRSILNAISLAFHADLDRLRYVHMVTGSLGDTAVLAFNKNLELAEFELFRPVSFMLATPFDDRLDTAFADYHAEEKFDGMRCQLHVKGGRVELFSRDLNSITGVFPELVHQFSDKSTGGMPDILLDGEICVFTDNTIQSFQWLQKRMGVKKPTASLLETYPVVFVAFDVLYRGGIALFNQPLTKRLELLDGLCSQFNIRQVSRFSISCASDLMLLFDQAIAHGNEGLVLKRSDSVYEFGQRRRSWLKVKQPGGSLDTVILYAHAGSGKRGGTYSDFTLGIRVENTEVFGQEFIPIGKAFTGYTDEDLKRINREIKPLILDRFGSTLMLKPELVVEIEFDEIQLNSRTKAGYTLRFPRFRAIRWDKVAAEADTLAEVERLYALNDRRKRLPQGQNPSFK